MTTKKDSRDLALSNPAAKAETRKARIDQIMDARRQRILDEKRRADDLFGDPVMNEDPR
jgi:hypothetical protein